MKTLYKSLFILLAFMGVTCLQTFSQQSGHTRRHWDASWIFVPRTAAKGYGIYKFRKVINLHSRPSSFIVHVSADNRYKLFVNGAMVSLGPARADFFHWNYETIDIAKYLEVGQNNIAALVWNEGDGRAEAQVSYRTAFILQGNSNKEQVVNTDKSWKCIKDSSYRPLPVHVLGYYAAGPGELVNMNRHVKRWTTNGYNDSNWMNAVEFTTGNPKGIFSYTESWMLQPSSIPPMEYKQQRLMKTRRTEGVQIPGGFPAAKASLTIPANSKATVLLDQTFLTNAYPTLIFSKGKNAGISLSYAELLYLKGEEKGNRDEVEGKIFIGRKDSIVSDGTEEQEFMPLSWRTYRYLQLQVSTKNEPLILDDLYGTFTGYPFTLQASFRSNSPELQKILEIGWRTSRLCAVETYMDCPYYEQLQYIGDTRIQGLVSLYNAGDDRLIRNALNLFDNSRMAEGITLSRFPTSTTQQIPFFSLWYIGMLHDYWMYRPDSAFIKEKLPGEREVLNFFAKYQQPDGSLKEVPYWTFTDWVVGHGWKDGIPPIGANGNSAVFDLQLLLAYQVAAQLEDKIGLKDYVNKYNGLITTLRHTVQQKYWDQNKKLFADTPEKHLFSQHANTLAILAGVVTGKDATTLAKKMLSDTSLAPASIYFKYYLHRAAIKAGLGNEYLNWLGKWSENIRLGLTTWAEMSEVSSSRSDCHAWGASPNVEFYRTVLGIDSDAPGFAQVKIEPHLGSLENVGGEIPHPKGRISVDYKKTGGKWAIQVSLPPGVEGKLIFNGKILPTRSGKNSFSL